jgi:acetylornithine deacetylase
LGKARPEVVFNIRDLCSSDSGFVVPHGCEAFLDLHLPPDEPVADLRLEMEAFAARERQDNSIMDAKIDFYTIRSGYELPEEGPLIEALKAGYGERFLPWNPIAFPSHSDANQLWLAGVKPVIVGCGQLEQAHCPDDSISFQQVITATEIYLRLTLRLLTY